MSDGNIYSFKENGLAVKKLNLNYTALAMNTGDKKKLSVTLDPLQAVSQQIIWSSGDEEVATVDSSGNVTAVAPGVTTITVKSLPRNVIATCEVHVYDSVANGNCGPGLIWTQTGEPGDYTLTIEGSGPMYDYSETKPAPWESFASEIGDIVLAEEMESIGDYAFCGCTSYAGPLEVPANVTRIGDYAFSGCSGITGPLSLGDSLTSIGSSAFEGCGNFLGKLTIPDSVTIIGKSAFKGCAKLRGDLTIPSKVAAINADTFSGCSGLTGKLTIPDVTRIDEGAFAGTGFREIEFLGSVLSLRDVCANLTLDSIGCKEGVYSRSKDKLISTNFTLKVNKEKHSFFENDLIKLEAVFSPTDFADYPVEWSSDNPASVYMYPDGRIYAVAPGTATITCQAKYSDVKAECKVTVVEPVASVSLNKTKITVAAGSIYQIEAEVSPEGATNKDVRWSSSDTSVATVSDGKVKGVKAGKATITVTTVDGKKTASCEVTVTQPVTGVALNKSSISLAVGKTQKLTATVSPANAANKAVTWKSSNTAIATASSDGTVKAVKAGTATITVTTKDGAKKAVCKVTVTQPVTGVKLSKTSASLTVGKSEKLTATVSPGNASNKSVTWKSSSTKIVTISSDGTMKAIAPGTATITVTTKNGSKTASCKVTVTQPVTSVKLSKRSTNLVIGKTEKLAATVAPANASNKAVVWKSSNTKVATVSSDGTVKAIASGTAEITVTSKDGSKSATCKVTVPAPIKDGWHKDGGKTYYYKNGKPLTGFQRIGGAYYYFDPKTGAMKAGEFTVDRIPCYFDPVTGKGLHNGWRHIKGKDYWYEKGQRQGTRYDVNGVKGDGTIRGREIFDSESNAWYWLDAVYDGAKAVSKEVWMPYVYSTEKPGTTTGKWVLYDQNGKMIKGWYHNPDSRTLYYNPITGAMVKGEFVIDGKKYRFNEVNGALIK